MATRLGARALADNTVRKQALQANSVDDTKLDAVDADTQRPKRRARVLAAQQFS